MKMGFLQVQNGPFKGLKYRFFQPITMGRDEDNTVRVLDPKVSRNHAAIEKTKEGFLLRDLKSTNGTYLNGEAVGKHSLRAGDKIILGSTELLFSEQDVLSHEKEPVAVRISTKRKALDSSGSETNNRYLSQVDLPQLKRRFQLLLNANRTISSTLEMKDAFEKVLEEIFRIFPADRGTILSLNQETGKLETVCSRTREGPVAGGDILISQSILNRVMEESVGLLIDDARSDNQFALSQSIAFNNIRSALCVPLIQKKEIIGIIYLDVSNMVKAFTEADLDLLIALAGPASVQIQNALYMNQLKKSYWDTIKALAQAVDARDRYTIGHNLRVSRFALAVASSMNWSQEKLNLVELAGILHDIGKIGVSDTLLLKKAPLNKSEMDSMRRHPEIGAKMIAGIDFLRPVVPYILYHHERWDGRGYPYGLKGDEIPEEGRLLAVCDSFDAMITSRPYREGLKIEVALRELVTNNQKQFDSVFVDAFLSAWRSKRIVRALSQAQDNLFSPGNSYCNLIIPSGQPSLHRDPERAVLLTHHSV